jgi:hypothetical protein
MKLLQNSYHRLHKNGSNCKNHKRLCSIYMSRRRLFHHAHKIKCLIASSLVVSDIISACALCPIKTRYVKKNATAVHTRNNCIGKFLFTGANDVRGPRFIGETFALTLTHLFRSSAPTNAQIVATMPRPHACDIRDP